MVDVDYNIPYVVDITVPFTVLSNDQMLAVVRVEKSDEAFRKHIFNIKRSWDIELLETPKSSFERPLYQWNTS